MPYKVKPTDVPERGTPAAAAYLDRHQQDFDLFHFLIDTVLTSDYVAYLAEHALQRVDTGTDEERIADPTTLAQQKPGPRTLFFREKRQAFLQMFLSRSVDNFQKYIVDLLHTILSKQPLILATRDSVPLDRILKFTTMEEFVGDLIRRKVTALSYSGFHELQEWCSAKGIPLVVPAGAETQLAEIIATRNIIAHNRGVVDHKFLESVACCQLKEGAVRELEPADLFKTHSVLLEVVFGTDRASIAKFALEELSLRKGKSAEVDRQSIVSDGRDESPASSAK
jgi:hypothetical protein